MRINYRQICEKEKQCRIIWKCWLVIIGVGVAAVVVFISCVAGVESIKQT